MNKSALEEDTRGAIRKIAARNAATFFKLQLENSRFINYLYEQETARSAGRQQTLPLTPVPTNDISEIVKRIGLEVDEKLRELCPEFRLQPKGYQLPTPRVRKLIYDSALDQADIGDPVEFPAAIHDERIVILHIARTYPDHSLPWILADDLLTEQFGDRQFIPIVIEGNSIAPPRGHLDTLAPQYSADRLETNPGAQLAFIIDNFDTSSKSRSSFLLKEIERFPTAKFIFVVRDDASFLLESRFFQDIPTGTYEICDVSFYEISHFIQKNFDMSGKEAEVVALRLRDTFKKFQLSAHPTYFAGIPKSTLTALLHANRRAELIELAVNGFLMFVVASDRSDVILSRTTRSRFLRKLAYEINVSKNRFTHEELVAYTKAVSKEYDFEIDPIRFIQAFCDKGILHFEGGRVCFSLPFIESYLLAVELKENPETAACYFSSGEDHFDLATFDLYSEVGASDRVVERVAQEMRERLADIALAGTSKHILLSDELQPTVLHDPARLEALQRRVKRAQEAASRDSDDKERKQRILDMKDRLRKRAAEEAGRSPEGHKLDPEEEEAERRIAHAIRAWIMGTILLGSGAEHLTAEVKERLVSLVLELGSAILDSWTRERAKIDFPALREDFLSDESVKSFLPEEEGTEKPTFNETRRIMSLLVDALEFGLLSEPLRKMVSFVCEQARHRVLAPTVERVKPTDQMERVLHSAWLADIESNRGKRALRAAISDLPPAPFMRMTLAMHFLTRVYWNHWKTEDRLALLDAASEALKPINMKIDKDKLKSNLRRYIEKDAD